MLRAQCHLLKTLHKHKLKIISSLNEFTRSNPKTAESKRVNRIDYAHCTARPFEVYVGAAIRWQVKRCLGHGSIVVTT
ncbi:Cadherin-1 [Dirofilaria immitis]